MEKYTRVKQLGKGSFGAAFLVKRIKDGELFVAKEVSMTKMTTKEKEEARHEVRVLSQLSHPNITQYTEHSERNGILYIIMEFADGGDLYQRIKASAAAKYARNKALNAKTDDELYEGMLQKKGPGASGMSEDLMMHFFAQMCLAIDYLHSKHILHRDVKSMNIFLTSRGTVKVGDFGISTVLRNTVGMAKTVCGTPYYFSPELCKAKPYNNKSDVWALGVLLYEMANVKHPFDASSMAALMQRICKGAYVPLPAATATNPNAGFSKGLLSLIAHCLDINVGTRYNIKQVMSTDTLRQALSKLEKDLMLATVCKVRLQTVIGHYDQRSAQPQPQAKPQTQQLPAIQQPPVPNPRVQPTPIPSSVPVTNNKLGPKPSGALIPEPNPPNAYRMPVRSEAMQVQRELEKVDKLIAYLKQPAPAPMRQAPFNNFSPMPPPMNQGPSRPTPSPSPAPAAREDATQDYIRKHQELQQIMAAHKKKVEENLKKRQQQEDQYQKEVLAKRHQYQMDNRPKVVPGKALPPIGEKIELSPPSARGPTPPRGVSPTRGVSPAPQQPPAKLPAITPRGRAPMALAANCLPDKKDKHAAAAEAWLEEQRRQAARKKAAVDAKRGKSGERRPSGGGDAVKGLGEYFEKRQREQDAQSKQAGPLPPPTSRADMPAGVKARKQLLGDDPMGVVEGKPEPKPSPSARPSVPSIQAKLAPLPAVRASSEPQPLTNQKAIDDHVNIIGKQLAAIEARPAPRKASLSPPVAAEDALGQLLQSFTKREDGRLPPISAPRSSPSPGTSPHSNDSPPVPDEEKEESEAIQTLRQKDYGNMLKHIQGLNVMLDEYGRRHPAPKPEEDEVVTVVYPTKDSPSSAEDSFTEEEVIDTSCYIGRKGGETDSDSDSSALSDFSEDTILDATVNGADASDFADVEPLTPSRANRQRKSVAGDAKPLAFDDQPAPIDFFRLAHICGAHFDGHAPTLLDGQELPVDGDNPPVVASLLEKYIVSERIASLISEDAVTPADRKQDGQRYRKEAAVAVMSIIYRLLNSIGDVEGGPVDASDKKARRDDSALAASKDIVELVLEASTHTKGHTSSYSVALTTLLSVFRRGLGVPPPSVEDRRAAKTASESSAVDSYIRSLILAVTEATNPGPRGAAVAKEGDPSFQTDEVNEVIALISQYIYFKWVT